METTEQKVAVQSELLSRKEAARYLGVSEATLAAWKWAKRYPLRCIKIGRLVKYRRVDLDSFIASCVIEGGVQ